MSDIGPRYSKEEFSRRGEAIFESDIRRTVEHGEPSDFVAIDIETGAYEVDREDRMAMERLLARLPKAQIWLRRVGSRFARRVGGGLRMPKP